MELQQGFYLDFPAAEYHKDPAPEPSLSASMAKTVMSKSAKHAYLTHPRLGGQSTYLAKDNAITGDIVHGVILGGGKGIVVVEAADYRTKAAQQKRDEAFAAGKVPIIADKYAAVLNAAKAIQRVLPFDFTANVWETESTAIWKRDDVPCFCRARLDAFNRTTWLIVDLKICENARISASARNIIAHGYHIQAASNIEAIETLFPESQGRVEFVDCFVESTAPNGVIVVEMKGSMLEYGQRQWKRAKGIWERAISTSEWPGYPQERQRVEAPAWAMAEEMEAQIDAAGMPPF